MKPLEMPWDEIRREYETTRAGWLGLATRYGIASKTSLKRRARAEGWERDEKAIAERETLADVVLDKLAIPVTLNEALADPPYLPPRPELAQAEAMPRRPVPAASKGERPPLGEREPLDPNEIDLASVGEMDPVLLVTSRGSGDENAAATRRHIALAAELQFAGLLLVRRLQGVLQAPEDPEGADAPREAKMLGDLQRLIRVNPDRETLTGLMTTAVKVVEAGMNMERKARGMDQIGNGKAAVPAAPGVAPPGGTTPPVLTATQRAIRLLDSMEPEMQQKMRDWAVRVQREKREAEITAAGGGQ